MTLLGRSRRLGFGLALGLMLGMSALALDPPNSPAPFVGTWQGQFQGKAFVTVKLALQADALAGTISRASVQFSDDGELTGALPIDGEDPIAAPSVSGSTLRWTGKGPGVLDTTQFEMKITGTDQADLVESGKKAWKLTRTSATADLAAAPAGDMKSKLMSAAQTWLSGQFGTTTPAAATTGTSSAVGNGTTGTAAATALEPLKLSDGDLDADLRKAIDALPRRIHDNLNNQGDMVNFVMVGSEKQMQDSLEAATWHVADRDNKQAVLNAVMQTYQKKDYLAMPMSVLYLFDRPQDYGYEEADPYAVVASRHHFRIWKAPFTWKDQTVWVGAGTHDIGFEKDQRNGSVTHKIDPAVDGERDNIGRTLQKANKIKSLNYYLPPDPVQEAKNATGGGYHSDGRLLVIVLQ